MLTSSSAPLPLAQLARWIAAILTLSALTASITHAETTASRMQSSMIWSPAAPEGTQAYVAFRKNFTLNTTPTSAPLHLFADSRYLLWVNGKHILRGPCRFNPKRPEFDTLDVAPHLLAGTNSLVVLVHHYPEINGRIMRNAPGLTVILEADGLEKLRTDPSWRCSPNTEFRPSPNAWSSIPDVIDGRLSPGPWTTSAFDDSSWQAAISVTGNSWGKMHARSIPLPVETELTTIKLKPHDTPFASALPIELKTEGRRPRSYPGGFTGTWMWAPTTAKKVWFKTIWNNTQSGNGLGCDLKILGDNQFSLFLNGRQIATSDDVTTGWSGKLDATNGDVITIIAEDLENGDHTAGLFVSMLKNGKPILDTSDFLGTTQPPTGNWQTNNDLTHFAKLSATNTHPAHQGAATEQQSFVIDLGRMAMAYPTIEIEADEGSVINLKYALRYVNGKPAETYGAGTTYTARAGRQSFIAADQWCGRYVTVTCISGRMKILNFKMTDRRYPFERVGSFKSNDRFLNKLWEMSVNTIECTSDDAYGSDARERNEWVQDAAKASYNTTRIANDGPRENGTKFHADPRLLRNMLRHAALSQISDGNLLGTFPTDRGRDDPHYIIEDYSCQWVEALQTYHDATGDTEFIREMWPHLVKLMDNFLKQLSPRGLLLAREYTSFDNPLAYITCEGANLNSFFHQALRTSATLARTLGESQLANNYSLAADSLHTAFNLHLWDANENAYRAGILADAPLAPTAHAQLLALHYGLVPDERKPSSRKWFLAHYQNPGEFHVGHNPNSARMIAAKAGIDMPITYYWAFHEFYQMDTAATDRMAINEMRRRWKYMVELQQDAGTLSEKFVLADGTGASESCHNYGSIPAYFLSSYVLGVRRDLAISEKQLVIEPRLADLTHAEGTVATEFGPVPVSWHRDGNNLSFKLEIPQGIQATLKIPDAVPSSLKIAGITAAPKSDGRHLTTTLPPGTHSGSVSLR